MSPAAAASPHPSSLTFAPHTAELSMAQNNLGRREEKKKAVPRLSPSWELIQLSKCPFASIRLHQTGRKSGKAQSKQKGPAVREGPFVVQGGLERVKCPR